MPTVEDFLGQAQSLLPQGPAWTRDKDANLTKLLRGFADMQEYVHNEAMRLIQGANPMNASALLPEWEQSLGLPEACGHTDAIATGTEDRRRMVVDKLNRSTSPTWDYFKQVAKRFDWDVDFKEPQPFTCGLSSCGDVLNGDATIRYNFVTVMLKDERVAYFRTGLSHCGERLGTIKRATELECILDRLKPAHVKFVYSYRGSVATTGKI